ncbi:MAG: hypothetical protein ACRDF9_11930 [Candidatus Limnocylindria bacterium]
MSFATIAGRATIARSRPTRSTLSVLFAGGLFLAAWTHFTLAVDHGFSVFAMLSLSAAAAQALLGAAALMRPSPHVFRAALFLTLMLIQLYALNVTVGLPPVIAHTHVGGSHTLLGVTLAWPNSVDAQGVVTQCGQLVVVVCAAILERRGLSRPHGA